MVDRPNAFAVDVTVNFGAADHDLHLQLPAGATGDDLYRLLGSPESGLGLNRTPPLLTVERTGRALRHDQALVDTTLMSGDRLVSIAEPQAGVGPTAEFLTGPRRAHRFTVPIRLGGATVLGRATDPGFDHGSVSRRHAEVTLSRSALTVEDLGSTNGTVVNGRRLGPGDRVDAHPGDVVEIGQISIRLVSVPAESRRLHDSPFTYRGGTLAFQQAPRAADPRPADTVELPAPPAAPAERRFPIGSAVLPLVMGGLLAYFFNPFFAVFMLMSPLMLAWTFLDDRRSGRKTFQADSEAFGDQLAAARLEAADTADQLAAWARRRTPTIDQIARWVRVGAPELWARRPRHDDFTTVAVGTAAQPPLLSVRRGDGGAPGLAARAAEVEAEFAADVPLPVSIDLGQSAVVGITGEGAAVARSLVAQLVGLRSYRDLRLAVLAPDRAADWEWCKWLPHTRADGTDAGPVPVSGVDRLIAGSDDEAGRIFERLVAVASERAERSGERLGAGRHPHPWFVVVLHPPVGLSPAAVARFLELAPTVGMSVIFLAPDRHDLPGDVAIYIEVTERGTVVHRLAEGRTVSAVEPWTLTPVRALTLARDLAPVVDVTVSGAGAGIPDAVSLDEATALTPGVSTGGAGAGLGTLSPDAIGRRVTARWRADPKGLAATIGVGAAGPVTLDLRADGPHALVAGTTGAGKSEFLQTLIADLATNHSPADLNFILIDYKGGAAFRECRRLPHTVGFVTDLDEHMAERALVSLRAELRHREQVLAEAGVSDLAGLQAKYRHSVNADLMLPALVIVIDEFAALKAEVPAFVDGLVDVAQRGRSMGVHMILATQKPGGVITPQIDANTNIRVALRVANENDSRELIGVTDAAAIANDRPGRALLKIGGGSQPIEFQSAYVGGRSGGPTEVEPGLASFDYRATRPRLRTVSLRRPAPAPPSDPALRPDADPALRPDAAGKAEPAPDAAGKADPALDPGRRSAPDHTDLRALVEATRRVWAAEPRRSLRRPWLPPLPEMVDLADLRLASTGAARSDVGADPGRPPAVTVGLADQPGRQCQEPYVLDLVETGHVAAYGGAGSGKSTLLRTVAACLSLAAEQAMHSGWPLPPPVLYGVDMAGGLSMLDPLPLVADVVPGSDHERLQLLLLHLATEVERRRELLARSGAGSLAELAVISTASGSGPAPLEPADVPPYIVVLIDGFGPFWDTLEKFDYGRQADDFVLLMGQSRSVGIHLVVTADQRSAIPFNCLGSIGLRAVQRLASADEYRSIGLNHAPDPSRMPPGRTFMLDGAGGSVEVQIGVLGDGGPGGAGGPGQTAAIAALGRRQRAAGLTGGAGRRIEALPDRLPLSSIGRPQSLAAVPLGLAPSQDVVQVNLADNPTLLVVGAAGSGRSTALSAIGHQLSSVVADRRVVAAKRTSPLVADGQGSPFTEVIVGDGAAALQSIAREIEERTGIGFDRNSNDLMLVVVDDADVFFDNNAATGALNTLVLKGRDAGALVVMAASSFRAGSAYETWIRAMRSNGHGLVLQPDGDKDQDLFDVRFPRASALRFPPGRGHLIVRSTVQAVHVATPDGGVSDPAGRLGR